VKRCTSACYQPKNGSYPKEFAGKPSTGFGCPSYNLNGLQALGYSCSLCLISPWPASSKKCAAKWHSSAHDHPLEYGNRPQQSSVQHPVATVLYAPVCPYSRIALYLFTRSPTANPQVRRPDNHLASLPCGRVPISVIFGPIVVFPNPTDERKPQGDRHGTLRRN
jgi:hypothetical protein